MNESKKKKIEKICRKFTFELNDKPTRAKLVIEINNTCKFLLVDKTTDELVYYGFVVLEGLDP